MVAGGQHFIQRGHTRNRFVQTIFQQGPHAEQAGLAADRPGQYGVGSGEMQVWAGSSPGSSVSAPPLKRENFKSKPLNCYKTFTSANQTRFTDPERFGR